MANPKFNKQTQELVNTMEFKVLGAGNHLNHIIKEIKTSKSEIERHQKSIVVNQQRYKDHIVECREIAMFLMTLDAEWFNHNVRNLITQGLFLGLTDEPLTILTQRGPKALEEILISATEKSTQKVETQNDTSTCEVGKERINATSGEF